MTKTGLSVRRWRYDKDVECKRFPIDGEGESKGIDNGDVVGNIVRVLV